MSAHGKSPGDVEVEITTTAPPEVAWQALTEPYRVAHWFGTLERPLGPGTGSRLDFGDGDFFAIDGVSIDPPWALGYSWRFLGIGPLDAISWRISAHKGGSRVIVLDREPGRTLEAARELRLGWLDFLERLQRYLETGADARYDWRREIEASIELPCPPEDARAALFEDSGPSRWLFLGGSNVEEEVEFPLADWSEDRRVKIAKFDRGSPLDVQFEVRRDDWRQPTRCHLRITPARGGSLLIALHGGWDEIGLAGDEPQRQRQRFCTAWIEALQRARRLVAG